MIKNKTINKIKDFVHLLELALCILIGFGIIICIPDLFKYFYSIIMSPADLSFELFRMFLKHVLILVVGVEFIIMLIARSNEAMLSLVLFVIARKMLVYSENMIDLLLGTIAVGIIFLVMKFLIEKESPHVSGENIYSAALPVDRINEKRNYNLPSADSMTLGGLVYMYAKNHDLKITEGLEFEVDGYKLAIIGCNEGVIEKVEITELED